ncbi:hypothetical protein SARC_12088 [Sphaeroforma arctica JP610]|uniref:PDZ domain-containing protein n=1 Tax=Sphaeroforma arctica JP610 TaxID=667725 RepID=A0A0L0FFY7_9EUKA|nr:hypothetical protein SARC_12088 [Sphaeroforma arctica JP610]KNC75386.1 hypothetical protein SARC_12088 [Sphaeroforma arctica JP610]|eukprot:XP_014149288.1 hypothetical protein SARC_12088 [Sphaeroforma arctica JP610]
MFILPFLLLHLSILYTQIDNQPFFKNCYLPLNDLWTVPPQNPHNKAVHGLHNVAAVREHAEASGNKANEEHADARLEKKHDPSTTGVDGHEEPDLFAQTLLDIGFECKGDRTISRVVTNSPAFKHQLVVGNVIVQLNDASTSSIEGDRFFIMLKHCLLEERIHIVHCHVTVAREMARGLRIMLEFYKRHKSINEYVNETLALDSLHPYNLAACDDPALNQVSTIEHDVTKLEAKLKKAHFKLQSRLKPAASNSSLNVSKHPSGAVTAPNSPSNTPRGSYALPDNSSDPAIAESQLPPHIQRVTATRSAGPTRRASGSDARWSLSWTHRTTSVQEDAKSQARGSQTHDLQSTRAESKSPETHHRVWSRFFRH